jgi:hypothetical protein
MARIILGNPERRALSYRIFGAGLYRNIRFSIFKFLVWNLFTK